MSRGIALVCSLLLLSSCSNSTEPAPSTTVAQPTSTSSSSTSTSTTTEPPTTTVVPTTEAPSSTTEAPVARWLQEELPDFDLTVDDPTVITDFEKMIDEYLVWRSWLAAHPIEDADELDRTLGVMYCPDGPLFATGSTFNDELVANRERYEIPPSSQRLTAFHPGFDSTADEVMLVYTDTVEGEVRVLDLDDGTLLRTLSSGSGATVEIRWHRVEENRWCLWSAANAT